MQRAAGVKTRDCGGGGLPEAAPRLPGAGRVAGPRLPPLSPASTWAWAPSAASRVFTHGDQTGARHPPRPTERPQRP